MKKSLYIILLLVEFLASFGFLVMVSALAGWAFFAVVTVVWAVLMVLQLVKLKKADGIKAKRKAKTLIALTMLLPAVVAFAGILWIGFVYF